VLNALETVVTPDTLMRWYRNLIARKWNYVTGAGRGDFGEASLRHALAQYMAHYHRERNHQGVGNQLLQNSSPLPVLAQQSGGAAASVGCSASIIARPLDPFGGARLNF